MQACNTSTWVEASGLSLKRLSQKLSNTAKPGKGNRQRFWREQWNEPQEKFLTEGIRKDLSGWKLRRMALKWTLGWQSNLGCNSMTQEKAMVGDKLQPTGLNYCLRLYPQIITEGFTMKTQSISQPYWNSLQSLLLDSNYCSQVKQAKMQSAPQSSSASDIVCFLPHPT